MRVTRLGSGDAGLLHQMMDLFSAAFEDPETYDSARPTDAYLNTLLARDSFIALVAWDAQRLVGGLTAYDLPKPERPQSELYLFDLAVLKSHRRRGIATALIAGLHGIAVARQAAVVYVQAEPADDAAVALYAKLGEGRDVLHFDLRPHAGTAARGAIGMADE